MAEVCILSVPYHELRPTAFPAGSVAGTGTDLRHRPPTKLSFPDSSSWIMVQRSLCNQKKSIAVAVTVHTVHRVIQSQHFPQTQMLPTNPNNLIVRIAASAIDLALAWSGKLHVIPRYTRLTIFAWNATFRSRMKLACAFR